ncbi:pyridoxamine 5'-phosphate oxidase family protein [Streptomyces sp. NPDC005859]|uniref:pyridoxamine 5'-phosphate oxidase family protein n=1 Tax=Streptomyces sp. NPDC005859 TaxID=3157170 RepID=UPI0033C61A25
MTGDDEQSKATGTHGSVELDAVEALRLLGSVALGRIVFTRHALPAIRPVNHVLVDGDIVIRTHGDATLARYTRQNEAEGAVVAYEADDIAPDTHLGWSVVVTGYARLVTDPRELARYRALLRPWVSQKLDHAVRISPDLITGIRLTADGPSPMT